MFLSRSTGKVTLQDVAKATGFTVNTVSRALKNKPDISRQTCEEIQRVAREMGYVRNYIASSLRSGRTKTIALIAGTMVNPFYAILADLIQREAVRLGYGLMILCSQDDPETELHMAEMALSRQADGVLISPSAANSPAVSLLRESGIPFVLLSRRLEKGRDDCVICDEEQGGYLAGQYLLNRGNRKLAMYSYFDVVYSTDMRLQGFRRACLEAGVPDADIRYASSSDEQDVLHQMQSWLDEGVTGLFSFCDVEAWSTITLMENRGVRIAEKMDIIGFDNLLGYVQFPRPISSIDCHLQQEAVVAIDLLRQRIHEPSLPAQQVTLPVSLVIR